MASDVPTPVVPDWRPVGPESGDLVQRMVVRAVDMPGRAAFVTSAGASMTYPELLGQAAAFAPVLRQVAVDGTIGVLAGYSPFGPISVVAAAIAGVRLVVGDPGDPPERLSAMFGAVGSPVVAAAEHAAVLDTLEPSIERRVIRMPAPVTDIANLSGDPDLLVTTSGSTSAPKVAILPLERWYAAASRWYDALRQCRLVVAGAGTYGYLNAMVSTFCRGATLAMFDVRQGSTSELVEFCARHSVTGLSVTPTMVQAMSRLAGGAPLDLPIEHANLRGERVNGADLDAFHRLFPDAEIIHMYASTEAGRVASWEWKPGDPIPDGPLPLGPPIAESEVRFLDADGHICADAPADPSELLFRAPLLFLGYVGRDSDDAFIIDEAGRRWFRTGDLVTIGGDGGLRVHGRGGRRVKVAGQFVDLDDVANAFERLDGIAQAAVTSFDDGDRVRLVGHLVPDHGARVDPVALRARLADDLPIHMVPSLVREVTDPPLNRSGKIDHLTLASWRPDTPVHTAYDQHREVASAAETRLLAVASDLIGRPVMLDDDLVDAGMVSLGWVELAERLRVDAGLTVELGDLLAAPTVRQIAAMCDQGARGASSVVAITSGDRSPPVFWVPNGIAVQEAVPLARALHDRSTFVPLARGFGRPGRVAQTVDQVVGDAVEGLDADGPAGPVIVAAFSSACQQAQAVAAELVSAGREVPLLVLLDPPTRRGLVTPRMVFRRLRLELTAARGRRRLRQRSAGSSAEVHTMLWDVQRREAARTALPRFDGPVLIVRSAGLADADPPQQLGGPIITRSIDGDHSAVVSEGEQVAAFVDDALAALDTTAT